jgi:UDP-N-acetylglucosamine--N-acetylmuramyl-(pentapeptide) pyrophosphoryl-undecaprenol N-acetylglucosamine transferase
MGRFFPESKVKLTGNPVRHEVVQIENKREEGLAHFGLNPNKKTLLIVGGSLGARSINDALIKRYKEIMESLEYQLVWQTGKGYFEHVEDAVESDFLDRMHITRFIDRMDLAYAAADIIVSRAGALSISELCLVAKPTILIPSPNVSEDHQTKNAMALVEQKAAVLIKDKAIIDDLVQVLAALKVNPTRLEELSENIRKLGRGNAPQEIVKEIHRIKN